jgi:putative protein-disulfide isomerase
MANLIYIADPMCSWCYGFGPQLSTLLGGLPETPLEIVVGGLRAYNTQTMDEQLKTTLLSHWRHVEEKTGLPFSYEGLSRAGFIYDTEPACRAVVAARALAPTMALAVFHAIQHAFYAEGMDVTQGNVLADVASRTLTQGGFAIDPAKFHETWAAEKIIAATRADFEQTQRWEITGFPTLVLEHNGRLDLVSRGYTTVQDLVEVMQELIDGESKESTAHG